MALSQSSIQLALQGALLGAFKGSSTANVLAEALSIALYNWIGTPGNAVVSGVTSGFSGAGSVSGKLSFSAPSGTMSLAFSSVGLVGPSSSLLADAVEKGVSSSFNSNAQYFGFSAGVGSGTDVSKVLSASIPTLELALRASLSSRNVSGENSQSLAKGIALGVGNFVLSGSGYGIVAGASSPFGAVGASTSSVA